MRGIALVILLMLAGCTKGPCPEGQARDNGGVCVAIAVPTQPLEDFDPFPQAAPPSPPPPGYVLDPAPAKDAYIATYGEPSDFNKEAERRRREDDARRDAEWAADRRADLIVEAQRETQRAVQDLRNDVRDAH